MIAIACPQCKRDVLFCKGVVKSGAFFRCPAGNNFFNPQQWANRRNPLYALNTPPVVNPGVFRSVRTRNMAVNDAMDQPG